MGTAGGSWESRVVHVPKIFGLGTSSHRHTPAVELVKLEAYRSISTTPTTLGHLFCEVDTQVSHQWCCFFRDYSLLSQHRKRAGSWSWPHFRWALELDNRGGAVSNNQPRSWSVMTCCYRGATAWSAELKSWVDEIRAPELSMWVFPCFLSFDVNSL